MLIIFCNERENETKKRKKIKDKKKFLSHSDSGGGVSSKVRWKFNWEWECCWRRGGEATETGGREEGAVGSESDWVREIEGEGGRSGWGLGVRVTNWGRVRNRGRGGCYAEVRKKNEKCETRVSKYDIYIYTHIYTWIFLIFKYYIYGSSLGGFH